MWEVLLGTAAANKAASIGVGLSVLLGAAGTAEVTGIGPAVREIVQPEATQTETETNSEDTEITVAALEDETTESEQDELAVEEENDDADDPNHDRERFIADADDAPGNLTWHLRGGAFQLRGILVADDGLAVRTAAPDGGTIDLPVDAEFVTAHIPGTNENRPGDASERTLEDYVGYLVRAHGECTEAEVDGEATECTVEELHILGNAGQSDAEDGESEASDDSEESEETDGTDDEPDEQTHGKPEHAGSKPGKPSEG